MKFEQVLNESLSSEMNTFLKQNYGMYKNNDYEYKDYNVSNREVTITFVPISKKPNEDKLEKELEKLGKRLGVEFETLYKKRKDRVIAIFKRISLMKKY